MAVAACGWVISLFAGAETAEHSSGVFVWVIVYVDGREVVASMKDKKRKEKKFSKRIRES